MNFTSKTVLFTITLVSFLLIGNATAESHDIHVVHHNLKPDLLNFCKKTTNPTLCEQTVQPHFIKSILDPIKALDIEVDAALVQTQKALVVIGGLLKKPGISKSFKDSLDICKDQYGMILDSIKLTKDAITKRWFHEARSQFSAVISYHAACKDSFEGIEKEYSLLAHDSDALFQLGGNCLDTIADLENSQGPKNEVPMTPSPPSAFSNVIGTLP